VSKRKARGLLRGPLHAGIPSTENLIDEQQVNDTNPLFELAKIAYNS